MRLTLAFVLSATALLAQTTVYLRTGTPGAFATISGASNTTPITITTTAAHGFNAGDLIYIQQVYGNWAANGLRKVASVPLSTTYTITDINNNPIAGNGTYTFSGFAGKVTAHTIVGHPRLLFDGPSGPLTTVMNGSVTKSIRADPTWPVFQGLDYMNAAHTGTADTNPMLQNPNYDWGPIAFGLAEGWFMDRTKTAYLTTAKWLIDNVEKNLAQGTTAGFWYPGFFTASSLGRGSDVDWASFRAVEYMYAYELIRDQLTSGEKTTFANKMLNNSTDYGESCTQPMAWQTGTFATTAGSAAIVGTGTDFTTLSGIGFAYIPQTTAPTSIGAIWGYMPTITDATHATLPAAATTTNANNIFFTVRSWQPGDCGWRWYVRNHAYSPMYDTVWLTVTLTAPVSGGVRFIYSTGFSNGYNHYVTIGPNTYSHIQVAGDTAATILTDLKNQITSAPDLNATATISGSYLVLNSVSPGTSTNCSASDGNSAVILNSTGSNVLSVQALPFPKSPPYLMYNGLEYMQVTAQSSGSGCPGGTPCLTVTRGYGNTTPVAYGTGKILTVADATEKFSSASTLKIGPELVPYDDPRENLLLCKTYGYMAVGLALADDDERARLMYEQMFNYWYDFTLPYDKRSWTGVTQSPTPGYNRRQNWNLMIADMALNSLSPAVDVTGGNWLKNTLLYYPALEFPGYNPQAVLFFADSGIDPTYFNRHLDGLQIALGLFPTDPRAQKYNWWFKTKRGLDVAATYRDSSSAEMASFGILLPGPSETPIGQINYTTTDPPHFTFNTVDQNDSKASPLGVWTSRTDWGSSGTSVLALSAQRPNDHWGSYAGPGSYKIYKGGIVMAGDAGPVASEETHRAHSNYMITGTAVDIGGVNGGGLIDRSSGDSSFAYIRVNNAGTNAQAYLGTLGVQRAYRHLLHVKGAVDTLFAYDDMATSSAADKLQNFYFYSDNYETPTFSLTGCTATYQRPTSQLITAYVLPVSPTCTHPLISGKNYSVEGNIYSVGQYKIHQLVVDAGTQSSVNMLAVHKAYSDTTSTMAATTVLSTTSTHDGVQVAGANPVVALFPKNGTTPALSAGFTSTHTGTAAIFVAGMVPGNYGVTINGGASSNYVADSSGVLKLSGGTAGTYAITNSDSQVPLSIGTTTLFDATLSVSYFTQLLGVGGVVPYTWALTIGSLPAGLSLNTVSGVISGIPTVTGAFSFTISLTDSASTVVTQALSLNVGAGILPVGVTSSSPNPAILGFGGVTLTASTVGGIAPFTWTLPTNTAGCLPTTGSGNTFVTTCVIPGNADILVTDSSANVADVAFNVIALPLTLSPSVLTTSVYTNQTFSASGGVQPYSWSAVGSANLTGSGTAFTTSWTTPNTYDVILTDAIFNQLTAPVSVVSYQTRPTTIGGKITIGGKVLIY